MWLPIEHDRQQKLRIDSFGMTVVLKGWVLLEVGDRWAVQYDQSLRSV